MKASCTDYVEKKLKLIVQHLLNGCEKLAPKEYQRRHNHVAKKVNYDFCNKNALERTEKWYEHVLQRAVATEEVKMLSDIKNQCDNVIEARRPDIILIGKKERKRIIIDTAVSTNVRVGQREKKKVEKYED